MALEAMQPQAGQVPATGTGQATEAKDSGEDRFGKLETIIQGLQHQVNGLSAALRVRAKEQERPQDQQPTQEQSLTLKSLKAELETRDQKIREKAIRAEVQAFAKGAGLTAESIPFFASFVREQYGSKLTVNEQDEVVFTDELGDIKPFAALGQKILSSSGGQTLLPPQSTPGGVGTRRGAYGVGVPSVPDLSQMTVEYMMAHPQEADAAAQAMAAQVLQGGTIRT